MDVMDGMLEQARREYPLECCGLLSGHGKLIDGIKWTTNQRASSREFSIPPVELLAFMKETRQERREFLGIYHSHPDGNPHPSRKDAAEFYYPGVSYWIVAVGNPGDTASCYKWRSGAFHEDSFEIIPGPEREA